MHSFTFNGHSSEEFGIRIERFPDLNRSARKFKSASVSGRNGNIYQMEDAWEEVTVSYQIFAGERQEGAAVADFTEIVEWLNSADDYAVLTDSYDPKHYRLAVFVDELEIESQWHTFGKATVRFRCRPQRFLAQGINNMPKISETSFTILDMTATVDSNGTIRIIGVNDVETSFYFPLEDTLVFTADMVGDIVSINILPSDASLGFCYNETQFYSIPLDAANKSISVPQEIVGETLNQISVIVPANTMVRGSIKPELMAASTIIEPAASGDVIKNPTNHIAHPIIMLTGADVYPNLLDLETPYNIASNFETANWSTEWLNNIAFVDAYLYGGSTTGENYKFNSITYTQTNASANGGVLTTHQNSNGTLTFTNFGAVGAVGIGRGVVLTPDTDYTISCDVTSGQSMIRVWFFESSGTKAYNSYAEISRYFSSAGTLNLTFHVPPTCSNTLVEFVRGGIDTGTFSNIRIVSSTSVQPFIPYSAVGFTEKITLGSTTLSFTTKGFSTAVIDCEKENLTVDGINYNSSSIVTDVYGNISPDYLRLESGDNAVSYTTDAISAVSIDPRMWEL